MTEFPTTRNHGYFGEPNNSAPWKTLLFIDFEALRMAQDGHKAKLEPGSEPRPVPRFAHALGASHALAQISFHVIMNSSRGGNMKA